jgi:hypothetical protein
MGSMKTAIRLLLVFLTAIALVAGAACGGDDDDDNGGVDGNGTVSPAVNGSPSPSATGGGVSASASPNGTEPAGETSTPRPTSSAPTPVKPALDAGVQQVGEGTIGFVLVPNGQFPIDGLGLIQPGTEPPPCAAFVFAFSWQITDPYPPGDSQVTWQIVAQDSRDDVASGAAGTASVGCGQLIASNNGPDQIDVSVHYVQGAIQ